MPTHEPISAAVDAIRAGKLSPIELVEEALEAIHRLDERLHAWVLVDAAGARAAAERLERQARQGELLGPLHGIPLGIKDIINVAGLPTVAGAPWRRGMIAADDAPLVARLRAAGAVILGKTITTQLAYLDPPPTRNPWNLDHTPGGSSSGSAAATAAGMCWAAIGTQTGGSILRPAAYCGVVGCKPTWGSVPTAGLVPLAPSLDTVGPITHCVEDAATLLAILQDRRLSPFVESAKQKGTVPFARPAVRLGFVEEFFMAWAEEAVQDAIEAAIEKLHAAGAMVEHVNLPASFPQAEAAAKRLMDSEAAAGHGEQYAAHQAEFSPHVAALVEEGLRMDGVESAAAREQQRCFAVEINDLFTAADGLPPLILAMPTTPTPAPARLDTTGDARFNIPWSFAGLPAVTIPCDLSPEGMPIGLQLVGPRDSDSELLAAAAWCERVLHFTATPLFVGDPRSDREKSRRPRRR